MSAAPPETPRLEPRLRRVLLVLPASAAAALAVYLVTRFGPAFRPLAPPIYAIIAVVTIVAIVHRWRTRGKGHDRRHRERRHQDGL